MIASASESEAACRYGRKAVLFAVEKLIRLDPVSDV
jgi:hypothetical protein